MPFSLPQISGNENIVPASTAAFIYRVHCYVQEFNVHPPNNTSLYLVGHYETRLRAYVGITMDFCRQKNNLVQLNKYILEESIPRDAEDEKEKAYIKTGERMWAWEVEKTDEGGDMEVVLGDGGDCEYRYELLELGLMLTRSRSDDLQAQMRCNWEVCEGTESIHLGQSIKLEPQVNTVEEYPLLHNMMPHITYIVLYHTKGDYHAAFTRRLEEFNYFPDACSALESDYYLRECALRGSMVLRKVPRLGQCGEVKPSIDANGDIYTWRIEEKCTPCELLMLEAFVRG